MEQSNTSTVSFDNEMLFVVDENDQVLGYEDKISCHSGAGILHRAFSIFIFNSQGQLLLQKRSDQKLLWPHFWSNSCCSHPRKNEWLERSTLRRLREELGFSTDLKFLFKFQYQAHYENIGSENEICSVFAGKYDGEVSVNENEISDWKFVDAGELDEMIAETPDQFTPWFKMEWERIRNEFWEEIEKLL